MTTEYCMEMCVERAGNSKLTEKFVKEEYEKAKTYDHYIEPIEIVFWCHRMNLPTTIEGKGGSIYGTNHSFIELCQNLIDGDPNGNR